MHYHILLTEKCNLRCKYCYEKSMQEFDNGLDKRFEFDFSCPESLDIDLEKLKNFLKKDSNAFLIFYGGEPLLQIEKIKQIIDGLKDIEVKFRMQTNGILLDRLPIKYLKKIDKILVSIDGSEERTDYNRGKGIYKKVIENIKCLRNEGYKGEIIARMTISQEAYDIYEQVLSLINLNIFDSYHWQIDAGFFKYDFNEKKFKEFVKKYNQSISKLIYFWIKKIEEGKVIRIYPFLGIIDSLLKNEKTNLRCGAGYEGYAITTNGNIVACPIMNCIKNFNAGNLDLNPSELKKFNISGRCVECGYLDLCGGRCLYWNIAKLWPEKGDELICLTIRHYIDELERNLDKIINLIREGIVKKEDFEYEKYFGPEIIP